MQQFTGKQYLQMDIASAFGLDKQVWDDRLKWFASHEVQIESDGDAALKSFVRTAKEPAQAYAGIMAYRATLRAEPTGYMCGLDATSSGIQLLAILAGCETSARACNLVNTGNREDAYKKCYELINLELGTNGSIPLNDIKQALMTHMYASQAVPREVFGEDTPELAAFYTVVDEMLPGANQLNQDLLSLWQPTALAHTWTLPDGFEAVIKVMDTIDHPVKFLGKEYISTTRVNRPQEAGLSLGANIVHSIDGMIVREMSRRCTFGPQAATAMNFLLDGKTGGRSTIREKDLALLRVLTLHEMTGFLSAVVVEYLDEKNFGHLTPTLRRQLHSLFMSMPDESFPLVCVHDCFKFHANNGNDVRQQYINILAELAESDIMSSIASEIAGRPIHVGKVNTTLPALIRGSEYAIC